MLNIQNNSYYPYNIETVTRQDGKIILSWVESTVNTAVSGNQRIAMMIYNQDGTAHSAISYTPWVTTSGNLVYETMVTSDNNLNIYVLFLFYSSPSPLYKFQLYKFNSSGMYSALLHNTVSTTRLNGNLFWLDSNRQLLHMYGGGFYYNIATSSTSTLSGASMLTADQFSSIIGHKSIIDLGIIYKAGLGVYKLNDGLISPTLLSNSYTGNNGRIIRGFNGIKYLFYSIGTDYTIRYKIISSDSSTISGEYILGVHPNSSTPFLSSGVMLSGNKLFLIISGVLYLLSQNLITGELSITLYNSSENFSTSVVFGKDSNIYLATRGDIVRYVDMATLNVGTSVNIISSSGYSGTNYSFFTSQYNNIQQDNKMFLHRSSSVDYAKFGLMISSQMFHSLIVANNGPMGVNNVNYQLTQLVFGYASVGTHYSTNFVYNFNSFIVQEINKNTPSGTTLLMSYSLDGGTSWTPCTVGLEVIATSSAQIQFKTVLTTSDSTVTPAFLDYAVVLKQ